MELEKLIVKIQADISDLQENLKKSASAVDDTSKQTEKSAEKIKSSLSKIGKGLGSAIVNPVKKMGASVKSVCSKISGMFTQAFAFGILSKGIEAFANKIKNIIGKNETLRASIAQLKGSFNTAVQPLIDLMIPFLQKAIGLATELANAFARVATTLTGKTIKATTEAAKKTEQLSKAGEVAGFDKLTKLNNTSNADYSSVIADAENTLSFADTIKKTFASIFDFVDRGLSKIADKLPSAFALVGDLGADLINKLNNLINKIAGYDWSGIGKSLSINIQKLFSDINWSSIADTAINLISGMINLVSGFLITWDWSPTIRAIIDTVWTLFKSSFKLIDKLSYLIGNIIGSLFSLVGSLVSELWRWIKQVFTSLGNTIKQKGLWGTIKDFLVSYVVEPTKSMFRGIWDALPEDAQVALSNAFTKTKEWFNKIIKWVETQWGKFTDHLKNGWETMVNGIRDFFKGGINGILGFINGLISGFTSAINTVINAVNKISWDIPDWVPLIGGKTFGFNVPTVTAKTIPLLAQGGIVTKPTLAMVGEKGKEAVLPLTDTSWMETLANILANRLASNNGNIILNVDGKQLGWASINNINKITRQTGSLQLAMR